MNRTKKKTEAAIPAMPKMPKFKTEAEEAAWWYKNRRAVEAQLDAIIVLQTQQRLKSLERRIARLEKLTA